MKELLKQINLEFADPNEAPAEPKPAATVLLVKDIQGGGNLIHISSIQGVSAPRLTLRRNGYDFSN